MDNYYNSIFEPHDPEDSEDKHYQQLIPTIEIAIFRKVLDEDLKIINNSKLSVTKWIDFKHQLLNQEKLWETEIIIWDIDNSCIDIIWDNLKNISTRYFQVHMLFEGFWMGNELLADVWQAIDEHQKLDI